MKKNILLALDKNQFVLSNIDCGINQIFTSLGGNSGNSVFQYTIQKHLSNENNSLSLDFDLIHNSEKTKEYYEHINSTFDCVIFASSSIISSYAAQNILPYWIYALKKIKIPIYVLSFGVCADKKDYEFDFIDNIKDIANDFIQTILKNGGKFGLRGYFSKEAMEYLGYKNEDEFRVIGCPSMFLKGDNLQISNDKINYRNFRPLLNGYLLKGSKKNLLNFLKKEENAIFIDQDEFFDLIYFEKLSAIKKLKKCLKKNMSPYIFNLLEQNRLKGFISIQDWRNFLENNNFNFCFGNRIHGSIFSILNNIPTLIHPLDTRVKEMAEYFSIPYIEKIETKNLYDLYLNLDYNNFNNNLKNKYRAFKKFFDDIDIEITPENTAKTLVGEEAP